MLEHPEPRTGKPVRLALWNLVPLCLVVVLQSAGLNLHDPAALLAFFAVVGPATLFLLGNSVRVFWISARCLRGAAEQRSAGALAMAITAGVLVAFLIAGSTV